MTKCDFLVLVRKTAKIWGIIFLVLRGGDVVSQVCWWCT